MSTIVTDFSCPCELLWS